MIKSFTDLGQSKQLAEFLPLESADMYYQYVLPKSDKIKHNPEIGNPINALEWYNKGYTAFGKEPITLDEYCVPCWSLAALLNVLYHPSLYKTVNSWRCDSFNNKKGTSYIVGELSKSPVDACYEMIVKLHKQNLL